MSAVRVDVIISPLKICNYFYQLITSRLMKLTINIIFMQKKKLSQSATKSLNDLSQSVSYAIFFISEKNLQNNLINN